MWDHFKFIVKHSISQFVLFILKLFMPASTDSHIYLLLWISVDFLHLLLPICFLMFTAQNLLSLWDTDWYFSRILLRPK